MFGIGLPEMIVIFAVALIVVGPDKLPELARSLAKGVFEMKKAVQQLKSNLSEEDETLNEVQQNLRQTADDLKEHLLDGETKTWSRPGSEEQGPEKQEGLIEPSPDPARPWEEDARQQPGEATIAPHPAPPDARTGINPPGTTEPTQAGEDIDKKP
ncbi:twin-arginine translocase TatA/TatE family subunit [Desulfogranum mediterraneum]|uniref:twin-arginine translocase TatA/TatE family subunit n=1 Tax=Desulfogranum mediterraneum TaxID=160661 RepID=UPI0003FF4948|nr:twin-arginine translocase TatA/TatE family subunit [Desulfogranum mediterraneum]